MGWVAIGAGISFGLALALLSAFFISGNTTLDRLAELLFVAFGIFAVAMMVVVADRLSSAGVVASILAVIGIVGAAGLGVGELASFLRILDFRRIAIPVTLAFVGVLAWIGGVSLLVVTGSTLPATLGWLGLGVIGLGLVAMLVMLRDPRVFRGEGDPDPKAMGAFTIVAFGIAAWMVWLGLVL